jgi:hypothetical protein
MGGACSTYEERIGVYRILVGKRDHLEDPCVDGRIILKLIFRKWDVEWGHGLDRDRWRALVNAVMNFRVP